MANLEDENLDEVSKRAQEFFKANPDKLKALDGSEGETDEEKAAREEAEAAALAAEEAEKGKGAATKGNEGTGASGGSGGGAPETKTLADLTGGRFNSVDDIDAYVNAQIEEKVKAVTESWEQSRYETDLAKRIDDLHKNGIKVDAKSLYEMSYDYSSVDVSDQAQALDLYKKWLKFKDPSITGREIDYEIRTQFSKLSKPLPDSDDEDFELVKSQREDELIKLLRTAKNAQRELVENQKKLQLPKEASSINAQANAERAQQARLEIRSGVEKQLLQNPVLSLQVDDETLQYKLNETEIGGALEGTSKINEFFNRYKTANGETDFRKLGEERIFLDNKEKIMTAFAKSYAKSEINKLLNKVRGTSPNNGSAPRSTQETRDERAERILREKGMLQTD